ncbi:UNVERIFIED_CONTAM: hypothetical protein NCL1_42727 [Trichonephila clavipes]
MGLKGDLRVPQSASISSPITPRDISQDVEPFSCFKYNIVNMFVFQNFRVQYETKIFWIFIDGKRNKMVSTVVWPQSSINLISTEIEKTEVYRKLLINLQDLVMDPNVSCDALEDQMRNLISESGM